MARCSVPCYTFQESNIVIIGGLKEYCALIFSQDNNEHGYEFLDQKRKRKVQEIRKLIHKFDIKTDELGLQITAYKTVVKIRIKLI